MRKSTNIIGRQPVVEALRDGQQLERIFIQKNIGGEIIDEIRSLAQKLQIPINVVPVEKLNYITRANHQEISTGYQEHNVILILIWPFFCIQYKYCTCTLIHLYSFPSSSAFFC